MVAPKSADRVRSWRMRNAYHHSSIYMTKSTSEQINERAKKHRVSRNELILTYIEWGLETERTNR